MRVEISVRIQNSSTKKRRQGMCPGAGTVWADMTNPQSWVKELLYCITGQRVCPTTLPVGRTGQEVEKVPEEAEQEGQSRNQGRLVKLGGTRTYSSAGVLLQPFLCMSYNQLEMPQAVLK